MDKTRKKTHPLIGVLATLYGIYLLYGIGNAMMDRYSVAKLTEQVKTACIGRFLIDLPQSMDFSYSRVYMNGFWVSSQEETQQEFEARVLARQKELEAEPNQLGQKNLELAEDFQKNGFAGKIFRFGRNLTKGKENGKPVDWINVKLEAYVHSRGMSFDFIADDYDPNQTDNLPKLLDQLRLVPANEIPTTAGFCFGPGMLLDPLPVDYTEGVTMFAGFKDHPDLAMVLDMRAGLKQRGPGPLERYERVAAERPLWLKALFTELRKRKRIIDRIEGDELAQKVNESNFVITYGFDWEVYGTAHDVFVPFIHLEMSTGHPVNAGARPVISFLVEEALIQLWDKISSSIRVRPTSTVPTAKPEQASGPKPGDAASAGDICPETGWWQCKDDGKGAEVAGGQRQFLKKGQRMPQALLLQPEKLRDKLRREQSSCQLDQPTCWTLLDRRNQARVVPAIQLAAPGLSTGSTHVPAASQTAPTTPVGNFAATGAPCPASGWWRCEDTEALDGTRWFARGELLPPATFQVARSRFRIGTAAADVFQRRSRWQLVSQGPDRGSEATSS